MENISPFASLELQSSHAGMQRLIQYEYTFTQRAASCESATFELPESASESWFLLALIGLKVDVDLRAWASIPIKQGGVAIPMPSEMLDVSHRVSTCEYSDLVRRMKGQEYFDLSHHSTVVREGREEGK